MSKVKKFDGEELFETIQRWLAENHHHHEADSECEDEDYPYVNSLDLESWLEKNLLRRKK